MFSTNFKNIGYSFAENKIFEKSKMATTIAECCKTAVT